MGWIPGGVFAISIAPELVLENTTPVAELNVPPGVPVMIGTGVGPCWQ